MKKEKVGMISLGCPKNLVDSENMLGILKSQNLEITNDAKQADIMVINTCAFLEDSKNESLDTIRDIAKLKKSGTLKKLIVTGCLVQRYKDELEEMLPQVDHVLGTGQFHEIAKISNHALPVVDMKISKPVFYYDYATNREMVLPKHTVYIKIAEGCSRTCSFCIIPKLRGPSQSRSIESVLNEVKQIAKQGTKEFNLIAQDLTAYGLDRNDGATLEKLLKKLISVRNIEWIRLMYNYPMYFSDSLIAMIAKSKAICKYLDMPLQHIDKDLLLSMRRKVDEDEIIRLLDKLRANINGLTLRTTFIVGFPNETEKQFNKLARFVEQGYFDHIGVFTYSKEEGTGAAMMDGQIEEKVKQERKDIIMKLQQSISLKKNKARVGQVYNVLIDQKLKDKYQGRFEGQAIDIDGVTYIEGDGIQVGDFVRAKIERATHYDLYARKI